MFKQTFRSQVLFYARETVKLSFNLTLHEEAQIFQLYWSIKFGLKFHIQCGIPTIQHYAARADNNV